MRHKQIPTLKEGTGLQNKEYLAAMTSHLSMKTNFEALLRGLFSKHAAVQMFHSHFQSWIYPDVTAPISEYNKKQPKQWRSETIIKPVD